ncbi:MAG: ribonuclease H-like YkuK family protein [Candidatus Yanofskybacteria bacterium]|nr:ribonuclease H-like YkuK family protein [Candidatus Yanofskybacteria bacterium]
MNDVLQGMFYNPTKGNMGVDEVLKEMLSYMKERPALRYEVIVGCDSSAEETPTFPVVIVVVRKGEGGRFFIKRVQYPAPRRFYNLHDRILQEVLLSCELALWLRENFVKFMEQEGEGIDWAFEYIHADVGQNGLTRDMIKEITGLIRGNGFEPRIKPESFVASSVADKFT